jgi:hypothetical protein
MDKVVLKKDVAEAIERWLRMNDGNKDMLLRFHADKGDWEFGFQAFNTIDLMTMASALINGYEVEKSPEDKVRERFDYCYKQWQTAGDAPYRRYYHGKVVGVQQTLDLLGIKITGVNA